jgi:hypothetical protein
MNISPLVHVLHSSPRLRSHLHDSSLLLPNVSLLISLALLRPCRGQTQAIQAVSDETKPITSQSSYQRFLQSIILPLIYSSTLLAADKMQHPHNLHCKAMDLTPIFTITVYNHSAPSCNLGTHPQSYSCLRASRRLRLLGTDAGEVMGRKRNGPNRFWNKHTKQLLCRNSPL